MSYSNTVVEQSFNGNGADTLFNVGFTYIKGETSSIMVELWDYTIPLAPVQLSFVLNTDYSINEASYPATEINLSAPLPVNHKLVVYRSTVPTQVTSLSNGAFPSVSVENALDRSMFVSQENRALSDRALVSPIGGPTFTSADLINMNATVAQNAINIGTNDTELANHETRISDNETTKADHITRIGGLETEQGLQAGRLTVNEGDILTLQSTVDILNVVNVASGPVTCVNKSAYIAQGNNIVFELPAPIAHGKVTVKVDGVYTGIQLFSNVSIDGVVSHDLNGVYQSMTVVSDGTKWYII